MRGKFSLIVFARIVYELGNGGFEHRDRGYVWIRVDTSGYEWIREVSPDTGDRRAIEKPRGRANAAINRIEGLLTLLVDYKIDRSGTPWIKKPSQRCRGVSDGFY